MMQAEIPTATMMLATKVNDGLECQIKIAHSKAKACGHDRPHQRRNEHRTNDDRGTILNQTKCCDST